MAKSRHGRSNVIVVACNSLHLGFLGCYGNAWVETPHLDRLASESTVFDFHFPENLTTLPTRRSWWTGRYGFPDLEAGWTPLRTDETTLPDRLWNHGIRSALISDTTYLRDPANGYGRGFDEVSLDSRIRVRPVRARDGRGAGPSTGRGRAGLAACLATRTTRIGNSGSSAGSACCATAPISGTIDTKARAWCAPCGRPSTGWRISRRA